MRDIGLIGNSHREQGRRRILLRFEPFMMAGQVHHAAPCKESKQQAIETKFGNQQIEQLTIVAVQSREMIRVVHTDQIATHQKREY